MLIRVLAVGGFVAAMCGCVSEETTSSGARSDGPRIAHQSSTSDAAQSGDDQSGEQTVASGVSDRFASESDFLTGHVQLTFADRYLKAGESYFSPDDAQVIFQAIEVPAAGEEPELFYQMYVADFVRDASGAVTGLENHRRLSPPGSSNTCGWFHPTKPGTVLFGSTIVPPTTPDVAGYQRGTSRYKWQFHKEMTIVEVDLATADGSASSMKVLLDDPDAYLAECSFTKDGRHLLFCRYVEADAPAGGDLFVYDMETGQESPLVVEAGYDGGPFFSPDEQFICYRSDRRGTNELQIFIAQLVRNEAGTITGIEREIQLTDNAHVNWAPFWHPTGSHLVYATSEVGHRNYEVYSVDTMLGQLDSKPDHELTKRRVTNAAGFDGLPVFNSDASLMMWTGQRDEGQTSQLWLATYGG